MDSPDYPEGKSPRRELQGPRPAPLKVRKDSHKIRKPPVVPQPPQPHQAPPRAPVIIYTVSPKVIHANPNEFMTLVQRLTGPDSTTCSSSVFASSASTFQDHHGGGISPAARFASIEKTKSPEGKKPQPYAIDGVEISSEVERMSPFPGDGDFRDFGELNINMNPYLLRDRIEELLEMFEITNSPTFKSLLIISILVLKARLILVRVTKHARIFSSPSQALFIKQINPRLSRTIQTENPPDWVDF